jgi:CHAT domain-containing protein
LSARPSGLPDARAVLARALTAGGTAEVVRELRTPGHIDTASMAPDMIEEAESRLRRDPRLAFWLAMTGARAAERAGRLAVSARGVYAAGQALANQGRMRGALRLYDRAIGRFHRLGARPDVAAVLIRRITPLASLGRYDEARAAAAAALRVLHGPGSERRVIEIENALGDLESRRDRPREALAHFRRARALVPPGTNPRLVAILDVNIANCLQALHRYGAAKRYFERARAMFEEQGLSHTAAQVDQNRAYFAMLRGRFAESLSLYERAESALRAMSDTSELAPIRLELAELYLQMGMPAEARVLARAAASRLEREGRAKESAQALYFAAVAELLDDRHDVAAAAAADARARFEASGDALWIAECDLLIAHAHEAAVDGRATARPLAESACRAFVAAERPVRAASAEFLLARLDLAAGRPASAVARLDQTEARTRRIEAPWVELELRRLQGLALLAQGDAVRGVESLQRALRVLEAHRGGVPADEFMVSFLASKAAVYAETVAALAAAGRDAEAFECCERSRSRALVDMLAARNGSGPAAPRRGLDLSGVKSRKLREDLNELYARLHRIGAGLERAPAERTAAMSRAVAEREEELASLARDAWSRDPEFASLSAVGTIGLARVQELLDDETTLVEYFVTAGRLIAFVVRKGSLTMRTAEVAEPELSRRVQRLRFHLAKFQIAGEAPAHSDAQHLAATRANLAELAEALVAPVAEELTTRRLVVVPHGVLHGMPFHALPWGEGWLSDHFDVSYAPSAAVYGFCAAKTARAAGPATVLALPDPAAPLIADEAAAVAAALGPDTVSVAGSAATAARLREAVATSRLVHVASHGMFRPDRPALSSIRLADTWLNLYDAYDLDVRADLVVLSACETGVVAAGRGCEALGLLRGFLYAGAPRVLASRWRVNDASTALFMRSFHGTLEQGGTYDSALRQAMTAVRERHPHPYHWAAFSLVGNSRGRLGVRDPK